MSSAARNAKSGGNPWFLAPQFDSVGQQIGASRLGMWLFVCAEILLFGALLLPYSLVHDMHPEVLEPATAKLDKILGLVGALTMLGSGLTMAMAVRSAKLGDSKGLQFNLLLTVGAAVVFLVLLGLQRRALISGGLIAGEAWNPVDVAMPAAAASFFGVFTLITSVFTAHVAVGIVVLFWMLMRARNREFSSENFVAVENASLYWQVLNVAWLFIFPLLFLVK